MSDIGRMKQLNEAINPDSINEGYTPQELTDILEDELANMEYFGEEIEGKVNDILYIAGDPKNKMFTSDINKIQTAISSLSKKLEKYVARAVKNMES